MHKFLGQPWQWAIAVSILAVSFCLGIRVGRYLEHDPELPAYTTTPAEAAIRSMALVSGDNWVTEQEQKIRDALERQIDIELVEMPFDDFIDYFRVESNVNCHIDPAVETHLDLESNGRINCRLNKVPLNRLLDIVLHERDLDWIVQNGVLLILTKETAQATLETRVYPVRDLGDPPRQQRPGTVVDPIIDVIEKSIAPDSWACTGGPGSIERFPNAHSLIVHQRHDVHQQIAVLLTQVRKSRQVQQR